MIETTLSRRSLLRGSALVVGFSLAGLRPEPGHAGSATAPSKSVATDEVDAYLALSRDGRATIYSGKVDLGTGVRTALAQIAAEELDLPLDHVTVVQVDTALTPDQGPTYGSLSVQNGGTQIRLAAATARRQILALAADRLGQKPETLVAEAGSVRPQDGGAPIPYADLLRDGRFSLKLDKDVATKDPGRFALVGQSVQRLDIPDKVSGRFTYMQDFRLPGMLHGRVVRPSAIGAQLLGLDEASVRDVPGLIKIVREGNFLGVVARTEWAAIRASRQLAAQWSQPETLPEQERLWEHVRATRVAKDDVTMNVGDAAGALRSAARTLTAT